MDTQSLISRRVAGGAMPDHGLRRIGAPGTILFGGGLPDPATHPVAELRALFDAVLAEAGSGVLGYGYEQGDAKLRELVAARMAADGIGAEGIVLTNGSAGAIGLVSQALLDPGDVVIAEAATYPGALKAFRLAGAEIAAAPMDAGGLDPAALGALIERLARAGRRVKFLYTIASCHNPTAQVLGLERRREVIALARRHGMPIIEDNTYGDIRFGAMPPHFVALAPDCAVHLGSFSKTIAPGLRVGWAAARPEIAAALIAVRTDLGIGPLVQAVVARYLESGAFAAHLVEITAHYRRKREAMLAALDAHCHGLAEWQAPDGGFFVWLRLTGSTARAALDAGEREGVSFIPGSYFAVEPGAFASHIRLSYGEVPENRLGEGISRLARAIERIAA